MTVLRWSGKPRGAGLPASSIDVGGCPVRIAASVTGPHARTASRGLAEEVVAEVAGLRAAEVRVATLLPSGRPVAASGARVLPVAVSLSHLPGIAAAAASVVADGVGIDVVEGGRNVSALGFWFGVRERAWAAATSAERVWGAKEAAFKAAGIDDGFHPREVEVTDDGDGRFRWRLADRWRSAEGAGRFVPAGRWLIAVATRVATKARSATAGRVACS